MGAIAQMTQYAIKGTADMQKFYKELDKFHVACYSNTHHHRLERIVLLGIPEVQLPPPFLHLAIKAALAAYLLDVRCLRMLGDRCAHFAPTVPAVL